MRFARYGRIVFFVCILGLVASPAWVGCDGGSEGDNKPETGDRTLDLGRGVTMKLALIPAGEFMMGSPPGEEDRDDDQGPQHHVRITKPFYMGMHEVTQEQYEAVMGADPSHFKGKDRPVETVSWNDAAEFCRKLSEKTGKTVGLPTEAEWEYACRAGTTTPFHTGETISTDQANYNGDWTYGSGRKGVYRKSTVAAGSFAPNGWGLYDMHGNVWEWCSDWYGKDYYDTGAREDPEGPATGTSRVLRGGSWDDGPWYCRSAASGRAGPSNSSLYDGFRVVVRGEESVGR